jgi:hypothetical protein
VKANHTTPYCAAHQPIGARADTNLVSYWQFERESNKTATAVDSVGLNNGTLYSGVTHTDNGRIGSAYEFDGINDYILVPNDDSIETPNALSWLFWFKCPTQIDDNYPRILDLGDNTVAFPQTAGTTLRFWLNNGTRSSELQYSNACDETWKHFTGTWDGTTISLYINGALQGTTGMTGTLNSDGQHFYISQSSSPYYGTLDEIMIWNRSLTADEIYEIYRDGNISSVSNVTADQDLGAATNISDANPDDEIKTIFNWYRNGTSISVLNMPFEGGSNSTWTRDYSPYGQNGTVSFATWNSSGGIDKKGSYRFYNADVDVTIDVGDGVLNLTDEITISTWVKPEACDVGGGTGPSRIVAKGQNEAYQLHIDSCKFRFTIGATWDTGPVTGVYNLDEWYHVVATYNGSVAKIYVNGTFIDDHAYNTSIPTTTDPVIIGDWATSGSRRPYNGTIDEVMIFNRSLTQEQILAFYRLETNRIASNETVRNETWYAEVTPNDGIEDSHTLQCDNVTIVNAKPDTLQVLINSTSTPITPRHDLACYAAGYDIDLDSPLTAHYQWYNNSVLLPSLSGTTASITPDVLTLVSTLGFGNTTKAETWTCEVKFYDGFINSTTPLNTSQRIHEVSPVLKFEGGILKLANALATLNFAELT